MKSADVLNIVSLVLLAEYLGYLCSRNETRNYFHLLEIPGLVPLGPWNRRWLLIRMLSEIHDLDDQYGRPPRTVAVVHKRGDKLPGAGYFRQRKMKPGTDKRAFFESDRSLAYVYYRSAARLEVSLIDAELVFDRQGQFVVERSPRRRGGEVAKAA